MGTKSSGEAFFLAGVNFFEKSLRNFNPIGAFRELVKNSLESKASSVDIFGEGSKWIVADNGSGMTPDELLDLRGLGRTSKGSANYGIGLKTVVLMPGIASVCVTSRDPAGGKYFQVEIGRWLEDGEVVTGLVQHDGQLIREVKPPYGGQYSTVIQVKDIDRSPRELVVYLNRRYLELPAGVEVRVAVGKTGLADPKWTTILGAKAHLNRLCDHTGEQEYPSCTLYWGIRRGALNPAAREKVVGGDDEFDAYPLYQAAQGEIFAETKTPRSLSSFGITAGERELIFIVEASGDVQYNLERTSVSPWEIEIAQGEVAAQLPEKVAAFIKAYEALFYRGNQGKDVAEDAVNLAKKVGATLDRVPRSEWVQGEGQRKPEPKPGEGDPDPAPEKEEGPKTKRDKSEKRKKRDKTTVLMARVPKVQFVDARALDPHRVRYDSVKKRIMLNRGANDCATVLKSLGTPKRQAAFEDDVREALLAAWISFCNQNQRVPNEEEIDAMYSAVVVCKV